MSGPTEVSFEGFVHADGGRLVDGQGRPLQLRGVGLGNWLLPEGYMWGFPRTGPQSPRQIEAFIVDLVGADAAIAFWWRFRECFISEADIRRIAAEGFDHVRLPMNARLLIDDAGDLRAEGLAPIDRLVEWCRQHGLWLILDLHGAPGGQTGTNIDDSPRGLPDLFLVGGGYRERTIALWTQLAARYRDETVIAGYDLLNEPLPHEYAAQYEAELATLYRDLTAAIRSVDPHHLLTYEGTRWSTDWSIFSEVWDPNSMLQFHKYWSAPDRPSIAAFVAQGEALSLPIYMGEGGENSPAWLQTAFGLYEDLEISWNFWPWKKLDTWNSPVSVSPPERWAELVRYASGQGPRPDVTEAQATLDGLLDRMSLDACEARPDVVGALFHRVPIRLAPEAFGFRGAGASYDTQAARPLDWFRSDDRVTIRRVGDADATSAFAHRDQPGLGIGGFEVVIGTGDWVEYVVEVPMPATLVIEVEVQLGEPDRSHLVPAVLLDGRAIGVMLTDGHVRGTTARTVPVGRHRVRIRGRSPSTVIRALTISPDV